MVDVSDKMGERRRLYNVFIGRNGEFTRSVEYASSFGGEVGSFTCKCRISPHDEPRALVDLLFGCLPHKSDAGDCLALFRVGQLNRV